MNYFISDILKRIKRPVEVQDDKEYKLVTIKLYHKGVVLREIKKGALIGSKKMFRVHKGDFILSGIDARNGAFGIVPDDLDGAIVTNDFWYFEVDENIITKELFLQLTQTTWFDDICRKGSDGTTQRIRLQKDKFFNQEITLPTPSLQTEMLQRITTVKELKSNLDIHGDNQTCWLAELKRAVLREAIEGKLTKDWRSKNVFQKRNPKYDVLCLIENIKKLQEEWIVEEKKKNNPEAKTIERKRNKKVNIDISKVSCPTTWGIYRLIDVVNLIVDCHNKTAPYIKEGIQILRTTNIKNMVINYDEPKYISNETYLYWSRRCPPQSGDLIYTREAPVGEAAIIPEGDNICLGQRLMLIRPFHQFFSAKYLLYAIYEPNFLARLSDNQKGAFVKHLRVGDVENALIPVPPLGEQLEIVQKVDKLLLMIDEFEKQVLNRNEQSEVLMKTVLHEAFEGGE